MKNVPLSYLSGLLAVLFFVAAAPAQRTVQTVPGYEKDMRDYAWRSIENPPVPGGTLFVGSSSFRIWGDKLEKIFQRDYAVNRGFGGSHLSHNIAALDRIHLPYRPARVVIFCGTNDLAHGKSVETVYADLCYYAARIWNENPLCEIFFVTPTHAPSREKHWADGDRLCEKVRELADKTPGLSVIDIITPMQGDDGRVREDLFVQDRLHLNEKGYAIWETAFKEAFYSEKRETLKPDVRELFRIRKALGLFDDPRFEKDGVAVKEPPAKDVKLNIVFIGDSITIGGGESSPPGRCLVYLQEQAGIDTLSSYSNQGVSGFTTVDFLPSKNKQFPKVAEAAGAMKDDKDARLVFSIMLGTNDSAIRGPNGSPVSPDVYRKNLREIVDRLLADYPDSTVVLHRPVWYSENTQNSSSYLLEGQLRVSAYTEELRSLVDFYATMPEGSRVFLGDVKAFHYFKRHHREAMHAETGEKGTFFLHPNQRGADVLGRFWGAALLDALR